MKWNWKILIFVSVWVISYFVIRVGIAGLALVFSPEAEASMHWAESGVPNTPMRQWQLVCDSNRRILALIQPDDGDSMVLYGSGDGVKWVNHGMYIDLTSAQRAGESLKGDCPK